MRDPMFWLAMALAVTAFIAAWLLMIVLTAIAVYLYKRFTLTLRGLTWHDAGIHLRCRPRR